MGRNAHLLRLAYGRSAFEPPQANEAGSRWRGHSQPGISGEYEQQYDDRGHPVNQQSRDYGRAMRAAQNDCLAAVGVVLKKEKLARLQVRDHYPRLDQEQSLLLTRIWGFAGYSIEAAALRCVYGIRDRIMAFPVAPEVSFVGLLLGQSHSLGIRTMCLAGLPSFIAAQAAFEIVASLNIAERLDRLGMAISTSRSVRRLSSSIASFVDYFWPDLLDLCTMPLQAHAYLQVLGQLDQGDSFPPLRSFNPLSGASPLLLSSPKLSAISGVPKMLRSSAVLLWSFEKARRILMTYLFESIPSVLRIVQVDVSESAPATGEDEADHEWPAEAQASRETAAQTESLPQPLTTGERSEDINLESDSAPVQDRQLGGRQPPGAHSDILITARTTSVDRTQGSLLITLEVQSGAERAANHSEALAYQDEHSHADLDLQQNKGLFSSTTLPVADVAYLCESLNSHLTRLIGNTMMLPLRMLLLQRMLSTFTPSDYSWHVPSRTMLWVPTSGKEVLALSGRLLLCCGLECATRIALWLGEVAVVIWQQRRKAISGHQDEDEVYF